MSDSLRLDIWLWRARFFKTRGLASGFIEKGKVRIGEDAMVRRVNKPATPVRPGDALTLALRGRIVYLRILELGTRRGPAHEAQALYEMRGEEADDHV